MSAAVAVLTGLALSSVPAGAADRDVEIEKSIASEFRLGVEKEPGTEQTAVQEGAAPVREKAESGEAVSAATGVSAEEELAAARKEIARLQEIVKRIVEASRREKADMHYNVACIFRSAGQYISSEQEFLKALAIAPDDPDIHYNLGILYEENLKNPKKARGHYERYIELAPSEKEAAKVRQWLTEMGM
jgi:tetratricopeptide (TPR) repeat protein